METRVTGKLVTGLKKFTAMIASAFDPNPGDQRLPNEVLRAPAERGLEFLRDPANAFLRPTVRCEDNHTILGLNRDGDRLLSAMRGDEKDRVPEPVLYSAFRHAVVPTLPYVSANSETLPPQDGRYAAIIEQRSGFFDDSGHTTFAISSNIPAGV